MAQDEISSSAGIARDGPCGQRLITDGYLCPNVHFGCYARVASSRLVRVAFRSSGGFSFGGVGGALGVSRLAMGRRMSGD